MKPRMGLFVNGLLWAASIPTYFVGIAFLQDRNLKALDRAPPLFVLAIVLSFWAGTVCLYYMPRPSTAARRLVYVVIFAALGAAAAGAALAISWLAVVSLYGE
ncbi:MAG: hypothetical protein JWQ73_158 [Variovorax sp.]|jgi:hypothetical protein|nr:hypothetical protein [Variovorax sp.]